MFRVIGMLLIVAAGGAVGAVLGLIGGTAFLEGGRAACEAAACADSIVRHFAPAGAIVGAMIGLGKAMSLKARRA